MRTVIRYLKSLRILVLWILVLTPFNGSGQQLKLSSSLEAGFEDRIVSFMIPGVQGIPAPLNYQVKVPQTWIVSPRDPERVISEEMRYRMFTELNISASWRGFTLYSDMKSWIDPESFISYRPVQVGYLIGVRYSLGSLEFNASHFCGHAIDRQGFQEGYDRVSVKYSFMTRRTVK